MEHWKIELGEFRGGFDICNTVDDRTWFVADKFVSLVVNGQWQQSLRHLPITVARLIIDHEGIDIVGPQDAEELSFDLEIVYHYHRLENGKARRIERLFTDEDMPHIGDNLSVVRNSPLVGKYGMVVSSIHWTGKIDSVMLSPILHEGLYVDVCESYGLPIPENGTVVQDG